MKFLLTVVLFLSLNSLSWAYLTAGYVAVTKTSSSVNTPSASENSDLFDTGTAASPGNVGVGSTSPGGKLDVGTGAVCINHVCLAVWPAGGSQLWSLVGAGPNITYSGNVGIGSAIPGQALDVTGTVRATHFTGQSGHGFLGVPGSQSVSTTYLAATDLIVVATGVQSSANCDLQGQIGVTSGLGTILNEIETNTGNPATITYIVPKGYYYQTAITGCATNTYMWSFPLGA